MAGTATRVRVPAETFPLFTSRHEFDFARLDLADLSIEEVATALARLFRWKGNSPVSVAMHSVLMSRCAKTKRVARAALMHDCHECLFAGDLPSPMRDLAWMKPWAATERRFDRALERRFGVELVPMLPAVKNLDKRALRNEVMDFLPGAAETVYGYRRLPVEFDPPMTPAQGRDAFLAEARRLGIS
jgi:hypothetical protein